MIPYWKLLGGSLLLCFGGGAVLDNVVALFGYGSWKFTLILVFCCTTIGLVLSAVTSRRLKSMSAASLTKHGELPPKYNTPLMRAISFQGWTREERLRASVAWFLSAIVFLILFWTAYLLVHKFLSSPIPGMEGAIALLISIPLTAFCGVIFYQKGSIPKH